MIQGKTCAGGAPARHRNRLFAVAVLALAALAAFAAPAPAKLAYVHLGKVDASASPPGSFGNTGPGEIEVNQATRDIYAVNPNSNVILVFTSALAYKSQITGAATPAGEFTISALAIDNSAGPNAGYIYVGDRKHDVVDVFSPAGAYVGQLTGSGTPAGKFDEVSGLTVDEAGALYVADRDQLVVNKFVPVGGPAEDADFVFQFNDPELQTPTRIAIDTAGNLLNASGGFIRKLSPTGTYLGEFGSFYTQDVKVNSLTGEVFSSAIYWLYVNEANGDFKAEIPHGAANSAAVDETSDRVFIGAPSYGLDYYERRDLPDPVTGGSADITDVSATVDGEIERDEGGPISKCEVEFGSDPSYGRIAPCEEATPFNAASTDVTAKLTGLVPGVVYHYRFAAENEDGRNFGADQTFKTFQAPTIEGFSTSKLLETSATLHAQINPQNSETTYRFEYGTTPAYGNVLPVPDGVIPASTSAQGVSVDLTGLEGVTYHFRVVAKNIYGETTTEDQTFDFFPPTCPNMEIRQETASNYLPDCRAYELVSPEDANGISWFPAGGPASGKATSPSRTAFTGDFAAMPGTEPINGEGDLYVATRTNTGWKTAHVGLPGNFTMRSGGPPVSSEGPDKIQQNVLTDPGMTRFVQWDNGVQNFFAESGPEHWPTNAPYVYDNEGKQVERWPSMFNETPGSRQVFECPGDGSAVQTPGCPGAVTASDDLSHFVFSLKDIPYHPEGISDPPGSAYDNDVEANTVSVISKLAGGEPIEQEAMTDLADEAIRIPDVDEDGSHIVMSTEFNAGTIHFGHHLFMRVNDLVTYDITGSHPSQFAGMKPDGSKLYFTSAGKFAAEDEDTSVDLYMWEPEGDDYTLASIGQNGNGNSDACAAAWTQKCDVGIIKFRSWAQRQSGQGGNNHSDNVLAAETGDIYFYGPEQLDGDRGLKNFQNLYTYRNGKPQHVAILGGNGCATDVYGNTVCSDGPVLRMQVSPDNSFMALLTTAQLTSYDNQGWPQMYRYNPATRQMLCVSCRPNGLPPTAEVMGSQNGLFMTDDGRTFFATKDGLVANDTNKLVDVYEYVEGRARLITTGTGDQNVDEGGFGINIIQARPGLLGVSADGTDVYFSTYDRLVGQDRNGATLKVYNARTGGGFPFVPPPEPCSAADECHGPSSLPPPPGEFATSADLGVGGNLVEEQRRTHRDRAAKRCKKAKKQAKKKACRGGRRGKGR